MHLKTRKGRAGLESSATGFKNRLTLDHTTWYHVDRRNHKSQKDTVNRKSCVEYLWLWSQSVYCSCLLVPHTAAQSCVRQLTFVIAIDMARTMAMMATHHQMGVFLYGFISRAWISCFRVPLKARTRSFQWKK